MATACERAQKTVWAKCARYSLNSEDSSTVPAASPDESSTSTIGRSGRALIDVMIDSASIQAATGFMDAPAIKPVSVISRPSRTRTPRRMPAPMSESKPSSNCAARAGSASFGRTVRGSSMPTVRRRCNKLRCRSASGSTAASARRKSSTCSRSRPLRQEMSPSPAAISMRCPPSRVNTALARSHPAPANISTSTPCSCARITAAITRRKAATQVAGASGAKRICSRQSARSLPSWCAESIRRCSWSSAARPSGAAAVSATMAATVQARPLSAPFAQASVPEPTAPQSPTTLASGASSRASTKSPQSRLGAVPPTQLAAQHLRRPPYPAATGRGTGTGAWQEDRSPLEPWRRRHRRLPPRPAPACLRRRAALRQ